MGMFLNMPSMQVLITTMLNGMLIWIFAVSSTALVQPIMYSHAKLTGWLTSAQTTAYAENVTVFGRINNIFDTYYAEQSSVRWGNPGDWWPGQGRNYRLGRRSDNLKYRAL